MNNTSTAAYRQDILGPILQEGFPEDVYVSTRVLPTVVVDKRNGVIPEFLYSNDQTFSLQRAPKTAYPRIQSSLGSQSYFCNEAGVEQFLSAEDYEILGKDRAEMLVGRVLVHTILRYRDLALSAAIFSGTGETTFATNLVTAANVWSGGSASTGTPLADILQAKRNIALQTGVEGNCLLIGYDAYVNLCTNNQIQTLVRNVMGYSGAYVPEAIAVEIPTKVLAMTFGLEEIIVARGVVNSATEAATIAGTPSRAFIWPSDYAFVFRKSQGAQDLREVAVGRTFIYDVATSLQVGALATGYLDMARAFTLEMYRREDINCDAFRCREYIDMEILVPTAGALIKSIA